MHEIRLKQFRKKYFDVTTEFIEQLTFQEQEYCIAEEIKDIRTHNGEIELLVKWKRFDDEEPKWEKYNKMKEDIPWMVEDFVDKIKKTGNVRQKRLIKNC